MRIEHVQSDMTQLNSSNQMRITPINQFNMLNMCIGVYRINYALCK